MKFSIIIPSYLGVYPTAAKNRDNKLIRAVDSALSQSYKNVEVIVIADRCKETMGIISKNFKGKLNKLKAYMIDYDAKSYIGHELFTGFPRNTGVGLASGEWIVYLDADDMLEKDHVKNIANQLNGFDWVYFDDKRWHPHKKEWYVNECKIDKQGFCGTSNIAHMADVGVKWNIKNLYGKDDWYFIKKLRQITKNYSHIEGGGYRVCHIPKQSGFGYDV